MRIATPTGPIEVWRPAGTSSRAGTVLYVHGYGTDLDEALVRHHLIEQFGASGLDATFVVLEAPKSRYEPVRFPDLSAVLNEVRKHVSLGSGPVVAVGHSGAFRTLYRWLKDPQLAHVVLLDALYAHWDDFREWARDARHRLTVVGGPDTTDTSESTVKKLGGRQLPAIPADVTPYWFDRVLGARNQFSHMGLVTNRIVIPALLQHTTIPRLGTVAVVDSLRTEKRFTWLWIAAALGGILAVGAAVWQLRSRRT